MTWADILTKPYLLQKYIRERKNTREIADELGCNEGTISRYLRKFGIATRSKGYKYPTLLDTEQIIRQIPDYEIPDISLNREINPPDKENINLMISDLHIGQKLFNETEDEAMEYFMSSFETLEDNIAKALSHIKYDFQFLNLFFLGDMVEGEGIYPTQAYESFQVMRQLDIAETGLINLIAGLQERLNDIPINIIAVRGNHGRTRRFSSEESNWDTVLYKLIDRDLPRNGNITFRRNDFWAIEFIDQFGNKYLTTHGDAIDCHSGIPHYGIDKAAGNWYMIFNGFDVLLMSHFHTAVNYEVNGTEVYINGCMRFNDFPIRKLKREPIRKFYMFGSGKDRPVTWTYKIDVEPQQYKNSLGFDMQHRTFGD